MSLNAVGCNIFFFYFSLLILFLGKHLLQHLLPTYISLPSILTVFAKVNLNTSHLAPNFQHGVHSPGWNNKGGQGKHIRESPGRRGEVEGRQTDLKPLWRPLLMTEAFGNYISLSAAWFCSGSVGGFSFLPCLGDFERQEHGCELREKGVIWTSFSFGSAAVTAVGPEPGRMSMYVCYVSVCKGRNLSFPVPLQRVSHPLRDPPCSFQFPS